MLVRALGVGLLALIAIPLVITYPPLALLGLGGWLLLARRPGRSGRKRGGLLQARSPRRARRRLTGKTSRRLGRAALWLAAGVVLLAIGAMLAREAPAALAILALLGIGLVGWRRRGRRSPSRLLPIRPDRHAKRGEGFAAWSGTEFERHVVDLLKAMNYRQVRHVGGPGDRGVDIVARDSRGRTFLVQCKRFASGSKVGSVEIQKLIGAVVHQGADGGIFVTTSSYTPAAVDLAQSGRVPIALVDGNDVARLSAGARW